MKQKYLMAVLAAGMLVLAGCGGGSSGISEEEVMKREKAAEERGRNSVVECKGDRVMVDENGECDGNSDYMSPADTAAMAARLWNAIGENPLGLVGDTPPGNNQSNPAIAEATGSLTVQRTGAGESLELSKDADAVVETLAGWIGSRHTAEASDTQGGGTYTAYLYSGVGEPVEGAIFNTLNGFANDELPLSTSNDNAAYVEIPSFTRKAGYQKFDSPDPNQINTATIPGSYRGVPGNYYCTPTSGSKCAVQKAETGLTIGEASEATKVFTAASGTWTFRPGSAEDRLMDTPDAVYAAFGWWLHEDADGATAVSAFTGIRGAPVVAASITALRGTATYSGGAAGKYAILGDSTSESGHFTADATLTADFNEDMVSGTIDRFRVGDDGMSMDWSVALAASGVSDTGGIRGDDGTGDEKTTTWTMGGTAADAGGEWSGTLYHDTAGGDGGVPKVGTGTFHAEYNNIGRMVGAFGVNLDE